MEAQILTRPDVVAHVAHGIRDLLAGSMRELYLLRESPIEDVEADLVLVVVVDDETHWPDVVDVVTDYTTYHPNSPSVWAHMTHEHSELAALARAEGVSI